MWHGLLVEQDSRYAPEKLKKIVPLVGFSRRQVPRRVIALNVVHQHVMQVVQAAGKAEEWRQQQRHAPI